MGTEESTEQVLDPFGEDGMSSKGFAELESDRC